MTSGIMAVLKVLLLNMLHSLSFFLLQTKISQQFLLLISILIWFNCHQLLTK